MTVTSQFLRLDIHSIYNKTGSLENRWMKLKLMESDLTLAVTSVKEEEQHRAELGEIYTSIMSCRIEEKICLGNSILQQKILNLVVQW